MSLAHRRFGWLAAFAAVVVAGSALGQERAPYVVEMQLWIDGEQRGAPLVVAAPGEPASIEVGDDAGSAGWRIEVLVEPQMAAGDGPGGTIWINVSVLERSDGEWSHLTDSLLGLSEGQEGTMTLVESGREPETPKESRVYLAVQAARLRPEPSGS